MMTRMHPQVAKALHEANDDYLEWAGYRLWSMRYGFLSTCESPIEGILGAHLTNINVHGVDITLCGEMVCNGEFTGLSAKSIGVIVDPPGYLVELWSQANIGNYRVDFLIEAQFHKKIHRLVIECDGHDFHERTKEQARRDRSRDRELQANGYTVFRYTGSEIFRDPRAPVTQIEKFLEGLAISETDERGGDVE